MGFSLQGTRSREQEFSPTSVYHWKYSETEDKKTNSWGGGEKEGEVESKSMMNLP